MRAQANKTKRPNLARGFDIFVKRQRGISGEVETKLAEPFIKSGRDLGKGGRKEHSF